MIGVKGLAFELKYQNGKQVEINAMWYNAFLIT